MLSFVKVSSSQDFTVVLKYPVNLFEIGNVNSKVSQPYVQQITSLTKAPLTAVSLVLIINHMAHLSSFYFYLALCVTFSMHTVPAF